MTPHRTTKKKTNRFETLGDVVEEYKEPDTIKPSSITEDPALLDTDETNNNPTNKHQCATDERLDQLKSTMGSIANTHRTNTNIRSEPTTPQHSYASPTKRRNSTYDNYYVPTHTKTASNHSKLNAPQSYNPHSSHPENNYEHSSGT